MGAWRPGLGRLQIMILRQGLWLKSHVQPRWHQTPRVGTNGGKNNPLESKTAEGGEQVRHEAPVPHRGQAGDAHQDESIRPALYLSFSLVS